jgi:heterodisulfide reductase subunit B2
MKKFAYYPGCSLEKMAASYHVSTIETARVLGIELEEIDDWNCCGATAYFHVDEILATTLCARNLAMAEKQGLDVVAPCSGCFKNMYFANASLKEDKELADHINYALEADDLKFSGTIDVNHIIEVFVEKVGFNEIKKNVKRPLKNLKVAPYYGCQLVRPRKSDDGVEAVEDPRFFEDLLTTIGATPVSYPMRLRCCGGSLIITNKKAALSMVRALLETAENAGADVIATACPLCQINLELYQTEVNREFGTSLSMPVMYFTQLLGLAFGIPAKRLGIGTEFVSADEAVKCARGDLRVVAGGTGE